MTQERTITINPENWVNDEAKVTIRHNTVKVNGETLQLRFQPVQRDEDGNAAWDFYQIDVMHKERKLVSLCRFGKDDEWECYEPIERRHTNPHVLAAIMACNLI